MPKYVSNYIYVNNIKLKLENINMSKNYKKMCIFIKILLFINKKIYIL